MNHKWYIINNFVNQLISFSWQKVIKFIHTILYRRNWRLIQSILDLVSDIWKK